MKKARRGPAIPFRLKLLAFGGGLALLPVLLLGMRALSITRDGMKTMTRELQLAVAGDVARTLDSELGSAQDALDLVGRTLIDRSIDEERAIDAASRLVSASELIDNAGVYAPDGTLVDAMREETLARHQLPDSLPAMLRGEAELRGVATGSARVTEDGARILLVVPVRSEGVVRVYVASYVSLEPLQARVAELASLRFEGRPGALSVVTESGVLLADGERSRVRPGARASAVPLLSALAGHRGGGIEQASGEYRLAGIDRVGTVVGLPRRGLWVVAQLPASHAYAAWFEMRRTVAVTAALAAFAAFVAAYVLSRRITRPIEVLASFATELSHRNFDRRVTLETRDELALLGEAMSAAAEDLEESEQKLLEQAEIRRDLGRYLPVELVDKVVRREHDMGLGGRRREITVLFADVVAFTPLSEKLEAEKVVALLNELFTLLTEIVFKHGGTVDKFIGDCVMALFGAADDEPEHARRAVAAAEDMIAWLETGNVGFLERYGVTLQLAIGINTGDAIVGNVGSETRMEYTAIGDVVNVAARLEAIARPQQILITSTTRELAGTDFEFVDRGLRELPGRAEAVSLFEVVP